MYIDYTPEQKKLRDELREYFKDLMTPELVTEIAGHLGLSRQTVPGHIKNIYRKLEVHTRGEAVFEALQQGLIRL